VGGSDVSVSDDDVRHVASLARLRFDDERVRALAGELNRILDHMEVLQQVDVRGIVPDTQSTHGMRLRDDVHRPIALHRDRASFAPLMRDGFFLVPRLATHDAAGTDGEEGES
jgi:aspartyl-tRNA(Asn)/glutamyl-tRNA(Gln) amidotransferase subunit C